MTALVVYDSVYGNTQKVAEVIGAAIGSDTKVVRPGQADLTGPGHIELLVVGSPTLGGRPSQPVQDWLASIQETAVRGMKVATFDTRYEGRFVKVFGFAADKMADALNAKGALPSVPGEGFIVTGKKGPLKDGELERASAWAKNLLE
ncbi:MAG: flavodoxin family protein [Thermoplasmata archaeon]|jgi:flavodoxin|nr:flavodoxin family protein [Thermoplasmata archaeon]